MHTFPVTFIILILNNYFRYSERSERSTGFNNDVNFLYFSVNTFFTWRFDQIDTNVPTNFSIFNFYDKRIMKN